MPRFSLVLLAVLLAPSAWAACPVDYAARKAAEIDTIGRAEDLYVKLYKSGVPEEKWSAADKAQLDASDRISESHQRPVDATDIRIVEAADALLPNEAVWNRHDTRDCPAGAKSVSLFCALHDASISVAGSYEHRRTALQEVRFAVEEKMNHQPTDHRLMDFNNLPGTSLADVKDVLHMARDRMAARLKLQAQCRL